MIESLQILAPSVNGTSAASVVPQCIIQAIKEMGVEIRDDAPQALLLWWDGPIPDKPFVVWQGDFDGVPADCRLKDYKFFGDERPMLERRLEKWMNTRNMNRRSYALKSSALAICNTSADNVSYYGKNSRYLGNTWPDRKAFALEAYNSRPFSGTYKIIGHIGRLNATGSSYGLRCLMEVLPHLRRELRHPYEVHIIGAGELVAGLKDLPNDRHVRMRGYVEDLDAELASADVVCLLNNSGPYKAGYSRHFMAWSTGSCLVCHVDSLLAIPDAKGAAVFGDKPHQIANLIAWAAQQHEFNATQRANGYALYRERFTPERIAKGLLEGFSGH